MASNETTGKAVQMRSIFKGALSALIVVLALSGLTATAALASGSPFVETKSATAVGEAWANLNGVVNPNGAATEYSFEYGTTTSYGKGTGKFSAGAGTANLEVSREITGLAPATTYHFRIVAHNANGTTDGADKLMRTHVAAPIELPEFSLKPAMNFPAHFSGTLGSATWSLGSSSFKCTEGAIEGNIAGVKSLNATTITFQACHTGELWCPTGTGEPEGQVKTQPLSATLVYLSKTAKTVGVVFTPSTGSVLAKFKCLGGGGEIFGSVVMPLGQVNKFAHEFALTATRGTTSYESEGKVLTASLETNWPSGSRQAAGWEFATNIRAQQEVEVKA
jgi:hypothetical protein